MSEEFTEDEVSVFCTKLELWGESLPRKERALLEILLKTASEIGSGLSDADLDNVAGGAVFGTRPTLGRTTRPNVNKMNWTYEENGPAHYDTAPGDDD